MLNKNELLDNILIEEFNINQNKVRKLDETKKEVIADKAASKILSSIRKKMKKNKLKTIDDSKGNISKFSDYSLISASISNLVNLSKNTNSSVYKEGINSINNANIILNKYQKEFMDSYKKNNELGKLLYECLVVSLIDAICFMYVNFVVYSYDNYGNQTVSIHERSGSIEKKMKSNKYFKLINKITEFDKSKKIIEYFNFNNVLNEVAVETAIGIAALVIAVPILILILVRGVIFAFYYTRLDLKEKLQFVKENLENNIRILGNDTSKDNNKVIEKQEKKIEKINKWMELLDYDTEKSQAEASTDEEKENKDISETSNSEIDSDII